jgi:hypothetical protein
MALVLNAHLGNGIADHRRTRDFAPMAEAAQLILRDLAKYLAPFEAVPTSLPPVYRILSPADYDVLIALRLTLIEALLIFRPLGVELTPAQAVSFGSVPGGARRFAELVRQAAEQTQRPAWEATAIVAWRVARDGLKELGHPAGIWHTSIATRFAALATNRMGFTGVTPNALAKRLQRMKWLRE